MIFTDRLFLTTYMYMRVLHVPEMFPLCGGSPARFRDLKCGSLGTTMKGGV